MLDLKIPNFGDIFIKHLLIDFNGTLAVDGVLLPETIPYLKILNQNFNLHVVTGDGFGTVRQQLADFNFHIEIVPADNQTDAKLTYLQKIGPQGTIVIGNGRNDSKALKVARIGIAVLGKEGSSIEAQQAADCVVLNIIDAFEMLQHPLRLMATLRG